MALKTILFLGLFIVSAGGSLLEPLWGVMGYMAHYTIGPEDQWWARPIRHWGLRYSLILAAMTAFGYLVNWSKLSVRWRYLLTGHEKALIWFLIFLWVLRFLGPQTSGVYSSVDHPTIKLTKVFIFCLMLTHCTIDMKSLKAVFWTLIISTLVMGLQAYNAPRSAFSGGRLEGVGGSDFAESNVLPAFIGGVLPLMGAMVLRPGKIKKIIATLAGVFAVNAIVLTRSRGALLGLAIGAFSAMLLAPKIHRKKIAVGIIVAGIGAVNLMDPGFINRIYTIDRSEDERKESAQGRLDTWLASIDLLIDYPLGCGPGNFKQTIGDYNYNYAGRDAHSTIVRCWSELGVPGFIFFMALILSALRLNLRSTRRAINLPPHIRDDIIYPAFALSVGLITTLGVGLFVTILYNEMLWWFLFLPVCLDRVLDNLELEYAEL